MSLDIKGLVVTLGGKEILRSMDLQIRDGELFSLLGPSGCGKTTLLKTIAGLQIQSSGSVTLGERCLDGLPPEKRDISVVFQELRLFPNMNVVQNVAFPLKMRKVSKGERLKRASEMLESVQLGGFEKRRIAQLSGGQQQRVALARALVANPKVMLLDEPFSSLDENLRDDMRDLLAMIHGSVDTTIVLVTHDQAEALKLSDRIAVMDEGRVLQCGTPQDVYDHPASLRIARYFSNSNIVEGTCAGGVFSCVLFDAPCELGDGPAVVMVRESAIRIVGSRSDVAASAGEASGAETGTACAGSRPASSSGIEFEVVKADYLGDRQKLEVACRGVVLELEAGSRDGLVGPCSVGDTINLSFDPAGLIMFSA